MGSKRIKEGGNRLQQARGKKEQTGKEHDPGKTYLRGHSPSNRREGGRQTEMKELHDRYRNITNTVDNIFAWGCGAGVTGCRLMHICFRLSLQFLLPPLCSRFMAQPSGGVAAECSTRARHLQRKLAGVACQQKGVPSRSSRNLLE
jgi:hypothetical protein